MTLRRPTEPTHRRLALAPGILAAIALLVGVALIETDTFTVVRFAVSILALIIGWFAIQARHWWWLPVMAAIAVLWNPAFPLELPGIWWPVAQYGATIALIAAGVLVKVPVIETKPGGARR